MMSPYYIKYLISNLERWRSVRSKITERNRFMGQFRHNKPDRLDNSALTETIEVLQEIETFLVIIEHRIIPSLNYAETYIQYVKERNPTLHMEADGTPSASNTIRTANRKLQAFCNGATVPLPSDKPQ